MRPATAQPMRLLPIPNVTPFLDVLLVLLILFMYLCLNQQKAITAQLPDPDARATDNTPVSCSRSCRTRSTRSTRSAWPARSSRRGSLDLREPADKDDHRAGRAGRHVSGRRDRHGHRSGRRRRGDRPHEDEVAPRQAFTAPRTQVRFRCTPQSPATPCIALSMFGTRRSTTRSSSFATAAPASRATAAASRCC